MRLGLIARADNSGLGIQTHEFYRHMHPVKTMVVNISQYNNNKQYPERYPDGEHVYGFPTDQQVEDFLEGLDVVFIAEAAYNPYLYVAARNRGVKVAVQYNYEFFDWFHGSVVMPDLFIAPSLWHFRDVEDFLKDYNARNNMNIWHKYLHSPVNREVLPRRTIQQARTFLHIAGRAAAHDRNGTAAVIMASHYLQTDAKIIIHFQGEQGLPHQATHTIADYRDMLDKYGDFNKVTIRQVEYENYQEAYREGDVLLLPRRYGGNCLPLNEALSIGMPAIMTDISPNSQFLPHGWLVPATHMTTFTPRTTIDVYDMEPLTLAAKIDEFYNRTDFEEASDVADSIANTISWEVMKPKYEHILERLCQ